MIDIVYGPVAFLICAVVNMFRSLRLKGQWRQLYVVVVVNERKLNLLGN